MRGQFFRANVGIVVARADGLVLALERADVPGEWQLPQGGLDEGEEPGDAALRELREETGIGRGQVQLIAEYPDWLAYELPPDKRRSRTGRGQVQRWFLYRFLGTDADIDPEMPGHDSEFRAFRWADLRELAGDTWAVRRPVYRALAREWADLLQGWGGSSPDADG